MKVINFWGNQRLAQFLFLSIILTPLLPPVALLCIAAAVLWHRKEYRFLKSLDWPEKAFIGFMLISAVSWLVEPSWFYGIPVGLIPIAMFGLYWMLAVWIRHLSWSWQEVQKTYLAFWLSGLYIAVIVFIQQMDWHVINDSFVGNILQFYNDFRFQSERSVRSIGTSGNSNLTAALLICFS